MQLILPFVINPQLSFDNFIIGNNTIIVQQLNMVLTKPCASLYIFGVKNSGKTHILQAYTLLSLQLKLSVFYLDLQQVVNNEINKLLLSSDIIYLDNLDKACIKNQQLVFDLYNFSKNNKLNLVISSANNIADLDIFIDLKTRLQQSLVMQILTLNDSDKILALIMRAKNKKISIDSHIFHYLIKNYSRDLGDLMNMLEILDKTSLIKKHKITIKMVKDIISSIIS